MWRAGLDAGAHLLATEKERFYALNLKLLLQRFGYVIADAGLLIAANEYATLGHKKVKFGRGKKEELCGLLLHSSFSMLT